MKCYYVMLTNSFLKGHPREGQKTNFETLVRHGKKIHTIRKNYPFWEKRVKEVNRGEAYLSVRSWFGKPYRSKQAEILKLFRVGIEEIYINDKGEFDFKGRYPGIYGLEQLADNDGLKTLDFLDWFKGYTGSLAIIHFTDFRYKSNLANPAMFNLKKESL